MTDADIDGAHIRTLLLTFFFRQMIELIEKGYVYVAQPPLFKVKKNKRQEYIYDDRELQKTLIKLGTDGTSLGTENGKTGKLDNTKFEKLLQLLAQVEEQIKILGKKGISLNKLLGARDKKSGNLPLYEVRYEGKQSYIYSEEEWDAFIKAKQQEAGRELEIIEDGEKEGSIGFTAYHESKDIEKTVKAIEGIGFSMKDYFREEDGKRAKYKLFSGEAEIDIFSLEEILPRIREMGRKGLEIQRYKGLGEMNAEELAETTMSISTRTLLRVKVEDAAKADAIFSTLAGKDVQRRREFIEKHALEVRNLDI